MRKFIIFISILAALVSCNSGKERTEISNTNNTDSIKNTSMQTDSINSNRVKREIVINVMKTTEITGEFECLDMELFKQCMEEGRANDWGPVYRKRLDSGIDIEIDGGSDDITYQETHPDSYFSIYKIFYKSTGYIREKGLIITKANSLLSRVGTWYFYDESGKLTQEINDDHHYKFTFNDVLAFCKKERIPFTKGKDYLTKTIIRTSDNEPISVTHYAFIDRGEDYKGLKYWWVITHYPGFFEYRTEIVLDGQTGKVISRHSGMI